MSNAAAAAAADAPAPKGKKKLIIIIAAALLVLLLGGGAAFMMMGKKASADDEDADGQGSKPKASAKAQSKAADPKAVPHYAPLEPFTVNLADREAERYAQIGITLEVGDPKVADQIKVFTPAIRNNILMVLAHKTSAQLLEREGKVKLAEEVKRAASRGLGYEVEEPEPADAEDEEDAAPKKKRKKKAPEPDLPITAVHFSNFIVQ